MTVTAITSISSLPSSSSPCIINFWASWSDQSNHMTTVFTELAKKYPALSFFSVEAESVPDVSEAMAIEAVPTFIVYQNNKIVARVNGANVSELNNVVVKYANIAKEVSERPTVPVDGWKNVDMTVRLKQLTTMTPIVLFMKGSPSSPKCGFSRQSIEVLSKYGVKYATFDILADNDVRESLKTFANWPTYPQLWVKGELIGGLDIMKELDEAGELGDVLGIEKASEKKAPLEERLKSLINRAPVMIFVKGSPEVPQCGFSRQLMTLLKEHEIEFDHFDILQDEEVRQGLKTFSDWPTYPQVYIRGELVGGLDVVKELIENGEFHTMVHP